MYQSQIPTVATEWEESHQVYLKYFYGLKYFWAHILQEEGCYPGEPQPAVRVPASALRRRAVPVHGDLSLRQQQQLHHHQLQPQQPGEQ